MRIFQSDELVLFGDPLPVPLGRRPHSAEFKMGRARAGFAFCLSFSRVPGAVGYHIFRSMSVASIRERSMQRLWTGAYSKEIRHFALAFPDVGTVVDDYGSRGASMMYYWVLAQVAGGHLVEVDDLVVSHADTHVLDRPHFMLRPGGGFVADAELRPKVRPKALNVTPLPDEGIVLQPEEFEDDDESVDDDDDDDGFDELIALDSDEIDTAPPVPSRPQPQRARAPSGAHRRRPKLHFSRYITPGGFAILAPRAPVHHYSVYVGEQLPDELDEAAMWKDVVYDTNPLEQFRLDPSYTGFRDLVHPGRTVAYTAVLAFMQDRTVRQVDVALAHDIEHLAILR